MPSYDDTNEGMFKMQKHYETAGIRCAQGKPRALSALISMSFAVTLGATVVGCSGEGASVEGVSETESNDAAEIALIESHLDGRGYDTSTLQFQGDTVMVEDDIEMSRAALLDAAEAEANGDVEKGYFNSAILFSGKRIQLSFGAGVSATWQTAMTAARNEWNSKTPMFSRDPGGAATISIVVQAMKDAAGNNNTTTFATGSFPSARTITLNSNFSSGCGGSLEAIAANVKTKIAMHEMGHVLGFDHPPPNPASRAGRVLIAGTTANTGLLEPSYATVMAQGCFSRTTLSSDDVVSAGKKYPSCMTTCENNCTFNVDPAQIGLCQASCPQACGG
jgi:hypothetical protein